MMRLDEIFNIRYGNSLELIKCEESPDGIPFVSRTAENNGVAAKVAVIPHIKPMPGRAISVAMSGSVLASFYQPLPFYTAFHVACLYPKYKLSPVEMLYYCSVIEKNKYRYNYGRQANKTLRPILVPAPPELPPFLKKYSAVMTFDRKPLNKYKIELNVKSWKTFNLSDLFEITGTKTTPLPDLEEIGKGIYPYVTTQATNNGVAGFYDKATEKGNVLTVDSAVIGFCSHQEFDFAASDHVEKLIPKFPMSRFVALFLATILNREQYRYNYGLKASQTRLKERSIKLPVKSDGTPDWDFMENYIKSLPYSANL
ncbi:MAG: restriction endonuclease subunit S [Planctomycetaceae bacterium]|jgi:hypothetical protein|nr:restriction endonuclease subunit S [Planctomycetaceae bacterium]